MTRIIDCSIQQPLLAFRTPLQTDSCHQNSAQRDILRNSVGFTTKLQPTECYVVLAPQTRVIVTMNSLKAIDSAAVLHRFDDVTSRSNWPLTNIHAACASLQATHD